MSGYAAGIQGIVANKAHREPTRVENLLEMGHAQIDVLLDEVLGALNRLEGSPPTAADTKPSGAVISLGNEATIPKLERLNHKFDRLREMTEQLCRLV